MNLRKLSYLGEEGKLSYLGGGGKLSYLSEDGNEFTDTQ